MKELNNEIAYIKYVDKYFQGFIKERGGLYQPLDEFALEHLNEEIKNGNIEIIEALTFKELQNKKGVK